MGKSWKNPHKIEKAQKKGQLFTKMAREISVAAKLGGPDPEGNSRLKMAIHAAKEVSCPKDTIEKAIKKGAGLLDGASAIEELTYEGLGPHGVGFMIECQTDNRNRTVSELRTAFKKHDGQLGETGSAAWMFDHVSLVVGLKSASTDPESDAIEAGANEVEVNDDGSVSFIADLNSLDQVKKSLHEMGWEIKAAERIYKAKNFVSLEGESKKALEELLEALDDLDDTHRVFSNLD